MRMQSVVEMLLPFDSSAKFRNSYVIVNYIRLSLTPVPGQSAGHNLTYSLQLRSSVNHLKIFKKPMK